MTFFSTRPVTDSMREALIHCATVNPNGGTGLTKTGRRGTYRGLAERGLIAYRGWHGARQDGTWIAPCGYYLTPAGWAAAGVDRPADDGRLTLDDALAEAYRAAPLHRGQRVTGHDTAHFGGRITFTGVISDFYLASPGARPMAMVECSDGIRHRVPRENITPEPTDPDAGRLTLDAALAECYPEVDAAQLLPSRAALSEAVAAFDAEPAAPCWEFREGAEAHYIDADGDELRVYASDADRDTDYVIVAAHGTDFTAVPVYVRVAPPGPDGISPLDDVDHLIEALRAAKRAALAARADVARTERREAEHRMTAFLTGEQP